MTESAQVSEPAKARKVRLNRCKWCGELFEPYYNAVQATCSLPCAKSHGAVLLAKKAQREAADDKRVRRKRLQELKPLRELLKESQHEFNAYIRARDFGQPCISCGRNSGAKMNAGHYRTTKAAPHLRFDERACFLQCEHCNTHLSGNQVEYRKVLIARFGAAHVEELDRDSGDIKWTREELIAIRKKYLSLWKDLKSKREGV